MTAGQGARTAGVTESQGEVSSLTQEVVLPVLVVVVNVTLLIVHVLVLLPGQRLAHWPGHAGSLAGQGNHLLGFVLHGCQRLLDGLLSDLTVVPGVDNTQ